MGWDGCGAGGGTVGVGKFEGADGTWDELVVDAKGFRFLIVGLEFDVVGGKTDEGWKGGGAG